MLGIIKEVIGERRTGASSSASGRPMQTLNSIIWVCHAAGSDDLQTGHAKPVESAATLVQKS